MEESVESVATTTAGGAGIEEKEAVVRVVGKWKGKMSKFRISYSALGMSEEARPVVRRPSRLRQRAAAAVPRHCCVMLIFSQKRTTGRHRALVVEAETVAAAMAEVPMGPGGGPSFSRGHGRCPPGATSVAVACGWMRGKWSIISINPYFFVQSVK